MTSQQEDDRPVSFERHVRATDYGVSVVWRWVMILAVIIGFGVQIGLNLSTQSEMKDSIADVRRDIAEFRKTYSDLNIQTDRNTRDIQGLQDLRNELRELRAQLDGMRSMREAYVYDSAKAARNKLLQQATTPP